MSMMMAKSLTRSWRRRRRKKRETSVPFAYVVSCFIKNSRKKILVKF
jgi:hypothetical protein